MRRAGRKSGCAGWWRCLLEDCDTSPGARDPWCFLLSPEGCESVFERRCSGALNSRLERHCPKLGLVQFKGLVLQGDWAYLPALLAEE